LDYLLLFLAELSTHEKLTSMGADNLAIGEIPRHISFRRLLCAFCLCLLAAAAVLSSVRRH